MKATFQNIGPIKQAELELGVLTVIAGQNNTGKTYLAYTLYGFLKLLQEDEFKIRHHAHADDLLRKVTPNSEQLVQGIIGTGETTMDIGEYKKIEGELTKSLSKYFSSESESIDSIFGAPRGQFQGAICHFEPDTKKGIADEQVHHYLLMESRIEGNKLVFKEKLLGGRPEKISKQKLQALLAWQLRGLLLEITRKQYPEPYILSAERFGISLFYKELDFAKNRLVEQLQNWPKKEGLNPLDFVKKESAHYAKSIRDNIDFTRMLPESQKTKSALTADKKRSVEGMLLAHFKVTDNEIRFISTEENPDEFNILLHLASSSARGLLDLYFYLRHVAKPGQLLIIDEPESHLSPGNQVLMARLLVFCVNNGIKVLITTHSDYLIKEINNLIMLHGEFEGKKDFLKRHEKDYTESDSLNPNAVRAYVCENGGLTPCDIDSMGMNMPVFDDAIDKINEISNELGLMRETDEHD